MAKIKMASRKELLQKLGLSHDELTDLLDKFRNNFLNDLKPPPAQSRKAYASIIM